MYKTSINSMENMTFFNCLLCVTIREMLATLRDNETLTASEKKGEKYGVNKSTDIAPNI